MSSLKEHKGFAGLFIKESIFDAFKSKPDVKGVSLSESTTVTDKKFVSKTGSGAVTIEVGSNGSMAFTVKDGSDTAVYEMKGQDVQDYIKWFQE